MKEGDDAGSFNKNWMFFSEMHAVMEAIKATSPDGGTKSRKSPEYICKLLPFSLLNDLFIFFNAINKTCVLCAINHSH